MYYEFLVQISYWNLPSIYHAAILMRLLRHVWRRNVILTWKLNVKHSLRSVKHWGRFRNCINPSRFLIVLGSSNGPPLAGVPAEKRVCRRCREKLDFLLTNVSCWGFKLRPQPVNFWNLLIDPSLFGSVIISKHCFLIKVWYWRILREKPASRNSSPVCLDL